MPLQYLSLQTSSAYKNSTPSSRSLSLSLTYFKHLQHVSLSLHSKHFNTTPILLLSLALSNIFQAFTAHHSLSICTPNTLRITTPLLSLPLSLIFSSTYSTSLPLPLRSKHLQITTPLLSLPLAPSRSLQHIAAEAQQTQDTQPRRATSITKHSKRGTDLREASAGAPPRHHQQTVGTQPRLPLSCTELAPPCPCAACPRASPPVRVHSVSRSGAKHALRAPDFRRAGTGCSEAW